MNFSRYYSGASEELHSTCMFMTYSEENVSDFLRIISLYAACRGSWCTPCLGFQ